MLPPSASAQTKVLRYAFPIAETGFDTVQLSDFNISMLRFILVGLGLMLLARFRPQGIFGSREEMALDRR